MFMYILIIYNNYSMKRGRVVLVLQGRYAGCKATILNVHEKSSKFKFAHIVVAGIERYVLLL